MCYYILLLIVEGGCDETPFFALDGTCALSYPTGNRGRVSCSDPYADANPYADSYSYANADTNSYPDPNADGAISAGSAPD